MNLAMWTSWQTRCGIASYTAALVEELQRLDVHVDVIPIPYTDRDPSRMAETLERVNHADLIHIQHEYTFFGGVAPLSSSLPRYLRGLKKPYVITAHTVFSAAELLRLEQETRSRQRIAKQILAAYPPYRAYVERDPFRRAKAVIVHTEAARERMRQRGIAAERIHVLPAGTPAAVPVDPALIEEKRRLWETEGRKVLTVFGYVSPDKGYETALEALASLPPSVMLLIAGGTRVEHERGYMDQLEATIHEKRLTERVRITGYLEDAEVAAAMALSDLVLVPHTAANGSYSVLIALSYGKPVLASDLACFREIAEGGGAAELFPPGDERALAERAGFLLASAGARKGLAERAAAYAQERSWASVAAHTRAIYEDILRAR